MTRKRFIKLLMSEGKTLRIARKRAALYNKKNISYVNAYIAEHTIERLLQAFYEQAGCKALGKRPD